MVDGLSKLPMDYIARILVSEMAWLRCALIAPNPTPQPSSARHDWHNLFAQIPSPLSVPRYDLKPLEVAMLHVLGAP